jgi:GAF domain-containing protein
MTSVSAERLAKIFVEIADTLVDDFDLIGFLQMITDRAAQLVEPAAVGLLLADAHGQLQFMAASDETARLLELFELQNQEGPCLDAFRTAQPVANANLIRAGARWPLFSTEAAVCGFASVHAFPLRLRAQVIGAMNVFCTDGGGLDESESQILQALADLAAIALLQERAISRGEVLAEQLQGALQSRIVIEQAKGVLAQAYNVDVDVAFKLIRSYARSTNRRLSEVAQAVVVDLASMPGLTISAEQRREE